MSVAISARPGDLLFVRGTGWISKEIERIEHSPYSHVAGIVKPNELIEAQGGRDTGYQGEDAYAKHGDIFTCDIATDEQRQQIIAFVKSKIGTDYDYPLIGWELLHYEFHLDVPYNEDGRVDCSQLWREAYQSAGIALTPGVKFASPGDLANSSLLHKVGSI